MLARRIARRIGNLRVFSRKSCTVFDAYRDKRFRINLAAGPRNRGLRTFSLNLPGGMSEGRVYTRRSDRF